MSNKTLLISIVSLLIGFTCAYFLLAQNSKLLPTISRQLEMESTDAAPTNQTNATDDSTALSESRFNARFESIEDSIRILQQQLQEVEFSLLEDESSETKTTAQASTSLLNRQQSRYRQRTFTIERLLKGGIDSAVADDIVRRKNAVELQRLELSDKATRENYMNTQRYFDELAAIDETDVNLRQELGDDQYDTYLFNSKQSNRVKILSVMLGSAAEQAGLEKGDIILSYDNNRLFTWSEVKQATTEGNLGEYTSINISRNGEVFSYSVPRGTLGIQMGSARIAP